VKNKRNADYKWHQNNSRHPIFLEQRHDVVAMNVGRVRVGLGAHGAHDHGGQDDPVVRRLLPCSVAFYTVSKSFSFKSFNPTMA
jgi:hypothetical protein